MITNNDQRPAGMFIQLSITLARIIATECSNLALRIKMAKKYGEESFGPTETHSLDDE